MKRIESVFQLTKHAFIRGIEHGVECLDVFLRIKTKSGAVAAILIPCLLQFPLMAFGQDSPDGVNGSPVPVEVSGEGVNGKGVVGNCGSAVGKGRLECVNGWTQGVSFVVEPSEPLPNKHQQQRTSRSGEPQLTFSEGDSVDFHLFAPLLLMWAVAIIGVFRGYSSRTDFVPNAANNRTEERSDEGPC